MKEIPLMQGYVALVDDEDYQRINQFKWCLNKTRKVRYAHRAIKQTTVLMHRFILGLTDPKVQVDHWDRNGLNNQRSNLRITRTQNQHNTGLRKDNASGYKGVYWDEDRQKWVANIGIKGKRKYLGSFTTAEEAALAYDAKAREVFEEFAYINFEKEKQ